MARNDLVLQLVKSGVAGDRDASRRVAEALVADRGAQVRMEFADDVLRLSAGADDVGRAEEDLLPLHNAVTAMDAAADADEAEAIFVLNDHLGDAYWRMDRRIEARFQWQRAMTLDPDDPEALRIKIENGLPDEAAPQSANR